MGVCLGLTGTSQRLTCRCPAPSPAQKKPRREAGLFSVRVAGSAFGHHVGSLWSLRALFDVKAHGLSFGKGTETLGLDGGEKCRQVNAGQAAKRNVGLKPERKPGAVLVDDLTVGPHPAVFIRRQWFQDSKGSFGPARKAGRRLCTPFRAS